MSQEKDVTLSSKRLFAIEIKDNNNNKKNNYILYYLINCTINEIYYFIITYKLIRILDGYH